MINHTDDFHALSAILQRLWKYVKYDGDTPSHWLLEHVNDVPDHLQALFFLCQTIRKRSLTGYNPVQPLDRGVDLASSLTTSSSLPSLDPAGSDHINALLEESDNPASMGEVTTSLQDGTRKVTTSPPATTGQVTNSPSATTGQVTTSQAAKKATTSKVAEQVTTLLPAGQAEEPPQAPNKRPRVPP